jgi:hypothetical protein
VRTAWATSSEREERSTSLIEEDFARDFEVLVLVKSRPPRVGGKIGL